MSADTTSSGNCPICKDSLSDGAVVQVRQKGADGINAASALRGDSLVVTAGCHIHVLCRERYTNKKYIQLKKPVSSPVETRSQHLSAGPFQSGSDCLFCGKHVTLGGSDFSYVRTDAFTRRIRECCERRSDDWSLKVKGRIEYYGVLLYAADCIYHHACRVRFLCGDDSSGPAEKRRKHGRPADADQEQAFLRVCAHLEMHDEDQFTISEVEEKMKEFLNSEDSSPYGRHYLKVKLIEHFGNAIFITGGKGISDTVTLREKTSDILGSFYRDAHTQCDEETQKRAIIATAARLIVSEIKESVVPATDYYPKVEDLTLDSALAFIPETLRSMLIQIFAGKQTEQKVASIGQALVQAARPRAVIAPLQIGLAVQMHHHYQSTFFLDTLSTMGFSSSYSELLQFQRNAASCVPPDSFFEGDDLLGSSWLFAADNVDHNAETLDPTDIVSLASQAMDEDE